MNRAHILWLPHTGSFVDYSEWWDAYVDQGIEIRLIVPDQRTKVDLLILPDFGGYNTTGPAFQGLRKRISPHNTPALPTFEHFRLYDLEYYLEKETPILAIGSSALAIWEKLSGKLYKNPGGNITLVEPFPAKIDVSVTDDVKWEFRSEFVFGISEFDPFSEDDHRKLLRFVKKTIPEKKEDGGGAEMAEVV